MRILCLILLGVQALFGQEQNGYFDFSYNDASGKIKMQVSNLGEEFLMVTSLASGIGSNDIGLDRGKLNGEKVVYFEKRGPYLFLVQPNLDFRANSDNVAERLAVSEAFATSIIASFAIEKIEGEIYTIDITPFMYEDHNGVAKILDRNKQGSYKLDKGRSGVKKEGLHAFPDNCEFESILTFKGDAKGSYIRSVTPSPESVSIVQHISFVRLPDDNYHSRVFHPYSGYYSHSYYDYATPIDQPINKQFITRHRLEKKDPNAAKSEAIEPIVYYIDRGCPEPIKSALIEGASWWNQAFEEAGFINAFKVKELPRDAHPLDVRYNMIQWVHRSTRGWSYGGSVTDPRTGEIIKGHVSLGSLRVRQDFMIAQGILSPFDNDKGDDRMMQMALARLRQLSAHEVGHTIGLAHNFAASTNERASVMDYPHPYIQTTDDGFDLSQAYDDKIGAWDKRAIVYGYGMPANDQSEASYLTEVITTTKKMGLSYQSDADARPLGSSNPEAHLWDNGSDPISELERLTEVRKKAMDRFGLNSIPNGTPISELEKVFVPIYYMHRYQAEAVAKLIGGVQYEYAVKGESLNLPLEELKLERQGKAAEALIALLSPEYLSVPRHIKNVLYPSAMGYSKNRESMPNKTGFSFDEVAVKEAAIQQIIELLLEPHRINRIIQSEELSKTNYIKSLFRSISDLPNAPTEFVGLSHKDLCKTLFIKQLLRVYDDAQLNELSKMAVYKNLKDLYQNNIDIFASDTPTPLPTKHYSYYLHQFFTFGHKPTILKKKATMPPGSPIGMGCMHLHH